ncbi:MAG TPA: hypothetical protein PLP05_07635 [Sedimentisphaerales bacterium]|nr:hypothetical protein [Sedimentisphaerales bacterium]
MYAVTKPTLVHVTHEAARKIGGIGAVLNGFFTCKSYLDSVQRSILVGPLFSKEGGLADRLGEESEIFYSTIDRYDDCEFSDQFRDIENIYNVGIIYGRRRFVDEQTGIESNPEIILLDVGQMHKGPVNSLKKQMYHRFNVSSDKYEHLWEFEQYVRIAPVTIAILKAIDAATSSTIIVSHEFMGMPTALAAKIDPYCNFKTIFYAHEVATIRRIVETHPGKDTIFYNILENARKKGLYLDDVMGSQDDYFKHPLVEASKYCDAICAVGDYTAKELKFLAPEFKDCPVDIVYNGIPAYNIRLDEKIKAKNKLQEYCFNLLGYRPDYVFTHVARLVKSKGLWRDLQVIGEIDTQFQRENKTAVLFVLSTETCQRNSHDIHLMESSYRWPVAHREGWPDLSGGEAEFNSEVQVFNARSKNVKVIFINQFGFTTKLCGRMMPEDMEFMDIRKGSDVEFGMSIYEPFGIAQLESLTFGGICAVSSVCGCAGFVSDVTGGQGCNNVIITDYTDISNQHYSEIDDFIYNEDLITKQVEDDLSKKLAVMICARIPENNFETEKLLKSGYELASKMSWEAVVSKYVLKSINKALNATEQKLTTINA